MPETAGLNHLGLAVRDLDETIDFFVNGLGWTESGRDDRCPRSAVSDGGVRLTLWQVDSSLPIQDFHRRQNVGLHHLALEVSSEQTLDRLADRMANWPGVAIEFSPELVGSGPRMHMMCTEPGGIRIEFIWPGA